MWKKHTKEVQGAKAAFKKMKLSEGQYKELVDEVMKEAIDEVAQTNDSEMIGEKGGQHVQILRNCPNLGT